MGKELSLARKKKSGRSVLLVGAGTDSVQPEDICGAEGKEEATVAEGAARHEVEVADEESKDNAAVAAGDGASDRGAECGSYHKARKPIRGAKGKHSPHRRSAEVLGIEWIGHKCSKSPTGAHHLVAAVDIAGGSIFACKYCDGLEWLPNSYSEAGRFRESIAKLGMVDAYYQILGRHPDAMKLLAKLQGLLRVRDKMSREDYLQTVAVVMSEGRFQQSMDSMSICGEKWGGMSHIAIGANKVS